MLLTKLPQWPFGISIAETGFSQITSFAARELLRLIHSQNGRNVQQIFQFFVLGGTTIAGNVFLLPYIQKKYGPRQILYGAFITLAVSYIYLAHTTEYSSLLIGMPVQVKNTYKYY